jgi:hypothetical protein
MNNRTHRDDRMSAKIGKHEASKRHTPMYTQYRTLNYDHTRTHGKRRDDMTTLTLT